MLSKWECIEKACEANGFIKSATIAHELENLLRRLYGETKTNAWKKDYRFFVPLSKKDIDRVVWSCEYCIGCEHSSENGLGCENCLLALEDFICASKKSLFYQFRVIYKKETNRLMDLD